MRLALAQFQREPIAIGIEYSVDFGGQPTSRAPHAFGNSEVPSGGCRRSPLPTLAVY